MAEIDWSESVVVKNELFKTYEVIIEIDRGKVIIVEN